MTTEYKSLNFLEKTKFILGDHETKLDYFNELAKLGDVVQVNGSNTHFFLNDPDAIYQVLVSHESKYSKSGTTIMRTRDILGVGQLTNYGEEWASGRQKLQANFYHKNLPQVFDVVNNKIDKMLNAWETAERHRSTLNLMQELCALSLEVSAGVLFGRNAPLDYKRIVKKFRFANNYVTNAKFLWPWKPTIGNIRFQYARALARRLSNEMLQGPHNDFPNLSPLLEPTFLKGNETGQERQWAIGQASNFFLASHDTTASVIAWLYYVADTSDSIQETLRKEAKDILQGQAPNFDTYAELNYTRAVLQETMRLYPPVWVIERRAIEEDTIGPFEVPEDAGIIICPYILHRHPKYWDNPDTFMPSRFSKDNTKDRPKTAYIPFGMGPRICTGQHLAMLISTCIVSKISQRFHLLLANKSPVSIDPLLTLKSNPDIKVKIQSI